MLSSVGVSGPVLVAVAMMLGLAVGHGARYGAQAAQFANLYPAPIRSTGLSVTQQFGAILGGGLSSSSAPP